MPINNIKYVLFILVVVTSATELTLHLLGYQPGVYRNIEGFQKVDKLILHKNFITDEKGIYKFSKWVTDSLPKYYNASWNIISNPVVSEALYPVDNLDYIMKCYTHLTTPEKQNSFSGCIKKLLDDEVWESEVSEIYKSILTTPVKNQNEWSKAVYHYLSRPFNSEGFRSIEFTAPKTSRKRILLVGDSFVYGMSAKPFYNSFYDILLSKGYLVYAAGIPGTDPAQYDAIARKYIPLLKPDMVIICFFSGNDFMSYERTPKANEPHEFITNAGFFNSNIHGQYRNAQQAYDYYLSLISIPTNESWVNRVLAKTSVGTLLWKALWKMGVINYVAPPLSDSLGSTTRNNQIDITQKYIDGIKQTCSSNSTLCRFVVIPDCGPGHKEKNGFLVDNMESFDQLFRKEYYFPRNFRAKKHFPKDDYHFNNEGHVLFASYLESIVKSKNDTNTY